MHGPDPVQFLLLFCWADTLHGFDKSVITFDHQLYHYTVIIPNKSYFVSKSGQTAENGGDNPLTVRFSSR